MARHEPKVWLGFDDEFVTEKHKSLVNFTTNKIGGNPDLPNNITLEAPICPLCQVSQLLVVQIYAPLENSAHHRTIYIFACINPNCWLQKESWTCWRIQTTETLDFSNTTTNSSETTAKEWCQDADDWDDNNANMNEENGNLINNLEKVSDEDDESCSFDDSLNLGMGNLAVDDQNANMGVGDAQGGAVGRLHSPSATAEIEGDEGEVISIDTPTYPQHDITALLQEVTPLPQDFCQKSSVHFLPCFMTVYEEIVNNLTGLDPHVRELLQEYQQKNDDFNINPGSDPGNENASGQVAEKYEKSNPAHGDKMFHHFLNRIQMNPGQILRYSRDSFPLLLKPLQDIPRKCQYCQGELTFECQLLPTIIPKLKLDSDGKEGTRLDFGNVLVFTCKRSCWSTDVTVRLEHVIIQHEAY